jgi:uncharacterized protein (DUF1684 family)
MSRLERFRERKDALFAEGEQSPLDPEQQERFEKLDYFAENPALDLTLTIDRSNAGTDLVVDTSDGQQRTYRRVGTITFPVGEEQVTMTLLAQPGQTRLFLPFFDGTTSTESYSGGRYLEPNQRPDGRVQVDFNYAYNPYCAYGDGWSCPIPPDENRTTARIEAGEKNFTLSDD